MFVWIRSSTLPYYLYVCPHSVILSAPIPTHVCRNENNVIIFSYKTVMMLITYFDNYESVLV